MRSKATVIAVLALALTFALTSGAVAQEKGTQITAWVDGEKLLEHTFPESMYVPGRVMFVPYNGVVRYDDVKVTSLTGEVLFADDFSGEEVGAFPSKWQRENAGGWTIVEEDGNKVLEQSNATTTGMSDLWPAAPHFDRSAEHVFEFRYKLIAWNGSTYRMNFIARGENRNNNYMVQYNERENVLAITHRFSGGDNRIVEVPFELEPGRWYHFKIEVKLVD